MKKLLLYLITFLVMVPTTPIAALLTLMGLVAVFAAIVEESAASPLAILSLVTFGFFGLASMWILFFHYLKNTGNPPRSKWQHCALLGGAAAALTHVASRAGSLLFRVLFFGWPLIGAVFFFGLLLASREARQ
jgi:hypothetical protein